MEETTVTGTLTVTPPPSSSSSSSLTVPEEIVEDILLRLPVKNLVQLQCVCKSWKTLIADPTFTKKHLHGSVTRHRFLLTFSHPSPELVITSYPLSSVFTQLTPTATSTQLEEYHHPLISGLDEIVGSCNGILCIKLHDPSFIVLWNPTITKFTKLPSLEFPEFSDLYHGFGYDHSMDAYKVVAFYYTKCDDAPSQAITHVYTMGTNFWRRIEDFTGFPNSDQSIFVSGTLNWLASEDIISLDLNKESYRVLLKPDYGVARPRGTYLCVLRDCLCILYRNYTFSDVWLMNEYGNTDSWTKFFRLRSEELTRPLYVYEEDDQVLLEFMSNWGVYNSRDGTLKTLEIQKTYVCCMTPQIYEESLVLPRC